MRIEVLIGSEEPILFPLKSKQIYLGSAETCDVVLSTSGISRKHVLISTEGDSYFVTDQGSTNGTFINEERLIPGRKVEFTSFFPVRLGDNVLVSLLSDDEVSAPPELTIKKDRTQSDIKITKNPDATGVINLKELTKGKTEKLVVERNQKRQERSKEKTKRPEKSSEKKSINLSSLLGVVILGGAIYYNFFVMQSDTNNEDVKEVGKVIIPGAPQTAAEKPAAILIPEDELPKKENIGNLLKDIKCTNDLEKFLCETIPGANGEFGVTQVGLTFNVMVDGSSYIEEARKYVKRPNGDNPDEMVSYENAVTETAFFVFFLKNISAFEAAKFPDNKITVTFFLPSTESGFAINKTAAFYAKALETGKENFRNEKLNYVRDVGIGALEFTKNIYRIY